MIKATTVFIISICVWQLTYGQTSQQLPEGTHENYVTYRDASISDEFNGSKLDLKKWGRRNTGGYMVEDFHKDSSLVTMESRDLRNGNQVNYVSVKGIGEDGPIRTAGIVSRASGYYGFYVVRFRYRGFNTVDVTEYGNIWHPAVWAARTDHIDGVSRTTCGSDFWLEIDFMEWVGKYWGSDAPARITDSKGVKRKVVTKEPGLEKGIMREKVAILDSVWQTIGLEYSPEHLKLWEWKEGQWRHIGDRVVEFVEDDLVIPESRYTISTIGRKARTPAFWILGNVVSRYLYDDIENGTTNRAMNDVAIDFDFFRYFRHVDTEEMDWPWENELSNGGGAIQKDSSAVEPVDTDITSVEHFDHDETNIPVMVYPNPVSDVITIDLNNEIQSPISFKIIDLHGKVVLHWDGEKVNPGKKSVSINLDSVQQGLYLVVLNSNGRIYQTKFVKKDIKG